MNSLYLLCTIEWSTMLRDEEEGAGVLPPPRPLPPLPPNPPNTHTGKRDIDDKLHFDIPPHLSLANLKALQEEAGRPASGHSQGSGFAAYFTSLIDPSLTWDCIAWLKSVTRLPILVKVGRGPGGGGGGRADVQRRGTPAANCVYERTAEGLSSSRLSSVARSGV